MHGIQAQGDRRGANRCMPEERMISMCARGGGKEAISGPQHAGRGGRGRTAHGARRLSSKRVNSLTSLRLEEVCEVPGTRWPKIRTGSEKRVLLRRDSRHRMR